MTFSSNFYDSLYDSTDLSLLAMRSLVFACIGLPNLMNTISIISCTTFQKITAMKVKLYYAIS